MKHFVVDYNTETFEPLMEHEVNGLDYKYVYGNDRLSVDISPITNSGHIVENGDHVRLYYHMDYLGTTDYLTSPVSLKVEAWTHYNEWGLITHNAVLKCGQRELDLVKRYATHDYDSVLELYYAKARFYDAHDRRFTGVDPILDPSQYDLREYVQNPVQLVQYTYVKNSPLIYIDPLGEVGVSTTVVYAGAAFLVGSLAAWFNTAQGKEAINNATKFIVDDVAYVGNAITGFVSDVSSGIIGFVGTIIIQTPTTFKPTVTQVTSGVVDGMVKTVDSYMAKAGCKDDNSTKTGDGSVSETDDSAKADEGTASSYEEAKKTGKKAPKHKNHNKGEGRFPTEGDSESSMDLIDTDGSVKQRRYFGKDRKPELDIDYHHGGTGHVFPHEHPWINGVRQ